MNYIENAIREAMEKGGWKPWQIETPLQFDGLRITDFASFAGFHDPDANGRAFFEVACGEIFLDPSFWRCLGKAKGWNKYTFGQWKGEAWKVAWHRFIDALAEGKSPEDFFKDL